MRGLARSQAHRQQWVGVAPAGAAGRWRAELQAGQLIREQSVACSWEEEEQSR